MIRTALVCSAAALVLAGCGGGGSSEPSAQGPSPTQASDDTAAHTPTDLRQPCHAITGPEASKVLGVRVSARKVADQLSARNFSCTYVRARQSTLELSLEIQSAPDPTPIAKIVGLYIGVDRLLHHPVDIPGADDAAVIRQAGTTPVVTVFAKQGFVTHSVVLGLPDIDEAERDAVRLMSLLVAANG